MIHHSDAGRISNRAPSRGASSFSGACSGRGYEQSFSTAMDSYEDRLLAALIHRDGGAVRVKCVLEECEVERAPDEHRSHRSAAVRGRPGVVSSEAFIPSTPPHLAGNSFGTASPIGGLGLPPDLVRRLAPGMPNDG